MPLRSALSWRNSMMAQASERPSNVAVPRPTSSRMISERSVALLRMFAVSCISTMNVDSPRASWREDRGAHARDRAEELVVEAELDRGRLLLGPDDLLLENLEVRRDVAFRADQRLLADVVVRDFREVRFRNLDVVAEDGVEADLQRADPGALPLPRLDLQKDRFRVMR